MTVRPGRKQERPFKNPRKIKVLLSAGVKSMKGRTIIMVHKALH